MHAKIKRHTSIGIVAILALALLVLLNSAVAKGPARNPVRGFGGTAGPADTGPFTGSGALCIRGQEHAVTIDTELLGPPRISDDGVLHVVSSHTFTFANGDTIITMDKSHLSPTDDPLVMLLNGNMEIVAGTAGVTGRLTAQGTLTVNPATGEGTTDFKIQGNISSYDHES